MESFRAAGNLATGSGTERRPSGIIAKIGHSSRPAGNGGPTTFLITYRGPRWIVSIIRGVNRLTTEEHRHKEKKVVSSLRIRGHA